MDKVYGSMEAYEEMIRKNERERMRAIRDSRKRRNFIERKERAKRIVIGLLQRVIGIAIIVFTVLYARSGLAFDAYYGVRDCTFALLTIPIGMCLTFGRSIYRNYTK